MSIVWGDLADTSANRSTGAGCSRTWWSMVLLYVECTAKITTNRPCCFLDNIAAHTTCQQAGHSATRYVHVFKAARLFSLQPISGHLNISFLAPWHVHPIWVCKDLSELACDDCSMFGQIPTVWRTELDWIKSMLRWQHLPETDLKRSGQYILQPVLVVLPPYISFQDNPHLHPALQLGAALVNFQHHKGRTSQTKCLDPGTWLSLVV